MRKSFIIVVSVVGLGLLALGFSLLMNRHHIDRDGCNRIYVGMSEEEVQGTLRRPPGRYVIAVSFFDYADAPKHSYAQEWVSERGAITILFDDNGKVVLARYGDVSLIEPSSFHKFRRWVGL